MRMTPFTWSVDNDTRARLTALTALDTEVDVVLYTYRRTEITSATSG